MDASGVALAGVVGVGALLLGRKLGPLHAAPDLTGRVTVIEKRLSEVTSTLSYKALNAPTTEMVVDAEERAKAAIAVLHERIEAMPEQQRSEIAAAEDLFHTRLTEEAKAPIDEMNERIAALERAGAEAEGYGLLTAQKELDAKVDQLSEWGTKVVAPALQQGVAAAGQMEAALAAMGTLNANVQELQQVALNQERTNEQNELLAAQVQQAFAENSDRMEQVIAAIQQLQLQRPLAQAQPQPPAQVQPPAVNSYPWDDPARVIPTVESVAAASGFKPPGADSLVQGMMASNDPQAVLEQLRARLLNNGRPQQ